MKKSTDLCYVKTIQDEDYSRIQDAVKNLQTTADMMSKYGLRCDLSHPHRFWEYGLACTAYDKYAPGEVVLDVGCGHSVLGPTLAYRYGASVSETDPDSIHAPSRQSISDYFMANKLGAILHFSSDVSSFKEETYDAVFCISVMEHVPVRIERNEWLNVARRAKVGGLVLFTCDIVPCPNRSYVYDNLRAQNYTLDSLRERVATLAENGFEPIGTPDYTYHGAFVHDYTFAVIGTRRVR